MVLIDINRFRDNEVLDEDNKYRRQENELNRKFILTRTNDLNELRSKKPTPLVAIAFDKLINNFNKNVISATINLRKNSNNDEEEELSDDVTNIIYDWNTLMSFYSNNLYQSFTKTLDDRISTNVNISYLNYLNSKLILYQRDFYSLINAFDTLIINLKNKVYQPVNYLGLNTRERPRIPIYQPPQAQNEQDGDDVFLDANDEAVESADSESADSESSDSDEEEENDDLYGYRGYGKKHKTTANLDKIINNITRILKVKK